MSEGTQFSADCYVHDTPIGENDNPVWLRGTDEHGNSGYFTDYYSSSRWDWNNTLEDQGLPYCGTGQPAPESPPEAEQQRGGVVYYGPAPGRVNLTAALEGPDGAYSMSGDRGDANSWVKGDCQNEYANDFPTEYDGRLVTTLAGWSLGRLGPIYFLEQEHDTRRHNIDYIVLFDPGSHKEYTQNPCDQRDSVQNGMRSQSETLARWLELSDNNQLVVLAGETTRDETASSNGELHSGLEATLLAEARRDSGISDQVVVCSYDDKSHEEMYLHFKEQVSRNKIRSENDCPSDSTTGGGW